MAFSLIALHRAHAHAIVILCMSCLSLLMDCLLHFHIFMHQHCCISFGYARYSMIGREARADGTEPQDGDGERILKMEGLAGVHA